MPACWRRSVCSLACGHNTSEELTPLARVSTVNTLLAACGAPACPEGGNGEIACTHALLLPCRHARHRSRLPERRRREDHACHQPRGRRRTRRHSRRGDRSRSAGLRRRLGRLARQRRSRCPFRPRRTAHGNSRHRPRAWRRPLPSRHGSPCRESSPRRRPGSRSRPDSLPAVDHRPSRRRRLPRHRAPRRHAPQRRCFAPSRRAAPWPAKPRPHSRPMPSRSRPRASATAPPSSMPPPPASACRNSSRGARPPARSKPFAPGLPASFQEVRHERQKIPFRSPLRPDSSP